MIAYQLHCHNGHDFEGWFRDSTAFDAQASAGKIICPNCSSPKIGKAVMAPAVLGTRVKSRPADKQSARELRQFAVGVRRHVEAHGDYVGPGFAEEARKIHYGESPDRMIYGETTLEDARALADEGLDIAPLPLDPEKVGN